MNLIHKHCGMRQLFGNIVRSSIGSQVVLSLLPLFLRLFSRYCYVSNVTNVPNDWILNFPFTVDCNLVEDRAVIFFLAFVDVKTTNRNGIIIYWRVRVPSNFDFSTTMWNIETHTHTHTSSQFCPYGGGGRVICLVFFILRFDLKKKIIPLLQLLLFMTSSRLCLLIYLFFLKAKNKRTTKEILNELEMCIMATPYS